MSARFAAVAALLLAVSSGAADARGPIRPLRIGNWSGGSYTNDATGAFSHCAVSAPYRSGITFHVSVTRELTWMLGFSHPQWSLVVGRTLPIDLVFDGSGSGRVQGTVRGTDFVVVPMPDDSWLIGNFRHARHMDAFANGVRYAFELKDTSRMLPALVDCVRASAGDPAPAAEPPAVVSPPMDTFFK